MQIQIYTMQSVEEAHDVIRCGVNHVGVTPSDQGLPGEIDFETARSIVDKVKGKAVSLALSVESDLDAIQNMYKIVQPDILHLCGLENSLPAEGVLELRERLPDVVIMQAISVADNSAIQMAETFEGVADYLILDTQAPTIAGIGASGETHDWNISREIVQRVSVPVVLAGGLSPDNVAAAVKVVSPWGVDSLTHTNRSLIGGGFKKDLERVRAFSDNARKAAGV